MKITFTSILVFSFFSCTLAAPQIGQNLASSNPLEGFPALKGFDSRPGFAFVDPDGVYRAYLADGSVIDAARLTPEQIQTWVDARAPLLSASAAEKERMTYASVNSQDVPETELLNPPDSVKPLAQIGSMAKYAVTPNPMEVMKRQVSCPSFYCQDRPVICAPYGCYCNSVICAIF